MKGRKKLAKGEKKKAVVVFVKEKNLTIAKKKLLQTAKKFN